jgi:hypothetical protein
VFSTQTRTWQLDDETLSGAGGAIFSSVKAVEASRASTELGQIVGADAILTQVTDFS